MAKIRIKKYKAQNGKTITVYDKNDPRYKSYQDSLNLNRLGFSLAKSFDPDIDPSYHYLFDKDFTKEDFQKAVIDNYGYVGKNSIENKIFNAQRRTGIEPVGGYNVEGMVPYFKPPTQKVVIPNIDKIPMRGSEPVIPDIQTQQLNWNSYYPQGKFPLYGNDNRLIGTYDQNLDGQTMFFPNENYSSQNQGEARGLPSNYIVPSPISTTPINVRRMENGGELSASKAKTILKENQANGKKLTPKQKRYFGYIAGGGKAANGTVVTDYGYGNVPNLTPAQQAALNEFVPYIPTQQTNQAPISDFGYYSPNSDGTFAINIDRQLMDRSGPSGYIGDTYSYGTNRSYGYEGTYGNRDYQPQMLRNTGYNRHFQNGGIINDTGYLQGYPTANNPMNIIPSGTITTDGMAFPIMANNTPLYPNTGTYQFPTNQVVETPMYSAGQELDLTEAEIKKLKKLGYEFE